MEKLARIEVRKLFGYLNQDIVLSSETGITILHGANGSGKTTILRTLSELSAGEWLKLVKRPMECLTLHFESGARLEYVPHKEVLGTVTLTRKGKKTVSWSVAEGVPPEYLEFTRRAMARQAARMETQPSLWADEQKIVESEHLRYYLYTTSEHRPEVVPAAPEWLKAFTSQFRCTLIEEQRLIRIEQERQSEAPKLKRVVAEFSKNVTQTIYDTLRRYGEQSQQLDRTFPHRMVEVLSQTPPDALSLEEKYNELETTRTRLQDAGLLDPEASIMKLDQPSLARSDVRRILSLYADDMKAKMSLFDVIYRKITLLELLLRDYFSHKTVKVSRKGIEIRVTDTGDILDATALSSGEQHIFVLFFTLIFKETGEYHLVLIDEPELSLHPRWQLRFIDDLERIREVSTLDFILASHSPLMFQGHMHMARDLNI